MPPLLSGGKDSGGKGVVLPNLLALAFAAALIPAVMGDNFLDPCSLVVFAMLSVLIVGSLITGCFFGRDARRDLQELAAGGASAGAIALGKTGAAAMRGWLLDMAVLLVGLLTVNLTRWQGHVRLPSSAVSSQAVVFSLAGSWLVAIAGALISLRASSARQARDRVQVAILVATLLGFDVVWFYPAELLDLPYIGAIAAAVLVAGTFVLFQPLRKQLGAWTTSDAAVIARQAAAPVAILPG